MSSRFLLISALAITLTAAEPRPLRVACMLDQTGSTLSTRVPQLQAADFEELLALLSDTGGEIAIGAIRDRSNRPLLRCRLDEKPRLRHIEPPSQKMNAFLRQKLMRSYLTDKQIADELEAHWREQNRKRVASFLEQLRLVLAQPLAGRTDIYGAIERADLFLNEPDDGWLQPTVRIAVFHSDGQDNVHARQIAMASGATVLVINGSGALGSLATLKPLAVESFAAAVRNIRARSREK